VHCGLRTPNPMCRLVARIVGHLGRPIPLRPKPLRVSFDCFVAVRVSDHAIDPRSGRKMSTDRGTVGALSPAWIAETTVRRATFRGAQVLGKRLQEAYELTSQSDFSFQWP
jgi:hypothetical protein